MTQSKVTQSKMTKSGVADNGEDFVTRRAEPADGPRVAALLGEASRGCFCQWWNFEGDHYEWQAQCNVTPEKNKLALLGQFKANDERSHGVVTLQNGQVVGWLRLTPLAAMPKFRASRVYRVMPFLGGRELSIEQLRHYKSTVGTDEVPAAPDIPPHQKVLQIGCITVAPSWRRRGVAYALIRGVVAAARTSGATWVFAAPRGTQSDSLRDDEAWMGPLKAFLACGFRRIDGPDTYPLLGLEITSQPPDAAGS